MTEDIFAEERQMVFGATINELALLMAGEPLESVALALDTVRDELRDDLSDGCLDLFLQAVLMRKIQIERGGVMTEQFQ